MSGSDFYGYANGEWSRKTAIPTNRASVGTFVDLRYNANARVRELLEEKRPKDCSTRSEQKAVMLYQAYMNEQVIQKLGNVPLDRDLRKLSKMRSKDELTAYMGRSFRGFGSGLFNLDISYDAKDPKHYAIYVGQAGSGLPSRYYYIEPQFANVTQSYEAYIADLFRLAAWPDAEGKAKAIEVFETRIA